MNMHGGWFDFPPAFSAGKTGGLRPLGDYLKITGDFCPWNGRIVFGCDDTANDGFAGCGVGDTLNRLIGQSNSNLWFTTLGEPCHRPAGRPASAARGCATTCRPPRPRRPTCWPAISPARAAPVPRSAAAGHVHRRDRPPGRRPMDAVQADHGRPERLRVPRLSRRRCPANGCG